MGDTQSGRSSTGGRSSTNRQDHLRAGSPRGDGDIQNTQQGDMPQGMYEPSQYSPRQNPQTSADVFQMGQLNAALPDNPYNQNYASQHLRYSLAQSPTGHVFAQHQNPHFQSGPGLPSPATATYNNPYNQQYHGQYANNHTPSPPNLHPGNHAVNQFYQNQMYLAQHQQRMQQQQHQQHQNPAFYMPHGQYSPQIQMTLHTAGYGTVGNLSGAGRHAPHHANETPSSGFASGKAITSPALSQSSVVRGPPRKPRQSGHAIWIGNLPPQTELMNLVYHVCREVSGLESLFLISKSNCAFANFKDETTCADAQAKIHDSRFQTVRLVSRLRRSSVGPSSATVPTSPATLNPPSNPPLARTPSPEDSISAKETTSTDTGLSEAKVEAASIDKFFIVKSLTVEDLELSVRNGIWATQSHNEESLNKAYQIANNVYLIFSANKSGEYFGYARMISPINDDPAAAIEFAPKAQAVEDPELPKAIPTAATEFAPKGRIIDDSARGTIFWEAERDEEDEEDETDSIKSEAADTPPSKAWGKPFKVEWVSTTRLPFYRTRGLRNPWNSNREVKIARDGTELETETGRRLTSLFHRVPSPISQVPSQLHGMPLMIGAYPNPPYLPQGEP